MQAAVSTQEKPRYAPYYGHVSAYGQEGHPPWRDFLSRSLTTDNLDTFLTDLVQLECLKGQSLPQAVGTYVQGIIGVAHHHVSDSVLVGNIAVLSTRPALLSEAAAAITELLDPDSQIYAYTSSWIFPRQDYGAYFRRTILAFEQAPQMLAGITDAGIRHAGEDLCSYVMYIKAQSSHIEFLDIGRRQVEALARIVSIFGNRQDERAWLQHFTNDHLFDHISPNPGQQTQDEEATASPISAMALIYAAAERHPLVRQQLLQWTASGIVRAIEHGENAEITRFVRDFADRPDVLQNDVAPACAEALRTASLDEALATLRHLENEPDVLAAFERGLGASAYEAVRERFYSSRSTDALEHFRAATREVTAAQHHAEAIAVLTREEADRGRDFRDTKIILAKELTASIDRGEAAFHLLEKEHGGANGDHNVVLAENGVTQQAIKRLKADCPTRYLNSPNPSD